MSSLAESSPSMLRRSLVDIALDSPVAFDTDFGWQSIPHYETRHTPVLQRGTIVVYSIDVEALSELYDYNPLLEKELKHFRPKKYLGVVLDSNQQPIDDELTRSIHGEQYVEKTHILPIGSTLPPPHKFTSTHTGIDETNLCIPIETNGIPITSSIRPPLRISPNETPFPYSDTFIWSLHGRDIAVAQVEDMNEDQSWRFVAEDHERFLDHIAEDVLALDGVTATAGTAAEWKPSDGFEEIAMAPDFQSTVKIWLDIEKHPNLSLDPLEYDAEDLELRRIVSAFTNDSERQAARTRRADIFNKSRRVEAAGTATQPGVFLLGLLFGFGFGVACGIAFARRR